MERGLQAVLAFLGVVAVVMGLVGVLGGGDLILDHGEFSNEIDSELRFFAAWYVAAGVFVLRAARRPAAETATVRILFGALFLAGCSRALSLVTVGTPHPVQVVLMVIELVLPFVVIPWQAALARARPAGQE